MTTPPEELIREARARYPNPSFPDPAAAMLFTDVRLIARFADALEAALSPEKVGMREALEAADIAWLETLRNRPTFRDDKERATRILAALGLPPPVVSGFTEDLGWAAARKMGALLTAEQIEACLSGAEREALGRLGSEDDPPQGLRPLDREPAGVDCSAEDGFARCPFKLHNRLDACHLPGGCLSQANLRA